MWGRLRLIAWPHVPHAACNPTQPHAPHCSVRSILPPCASCNTCPRPAPCNACIRHPPRHACVPHAVCTLDWPHAPHTPAGHSTAHTSPGSSCLCAAYIGLAPQVQHMEPGPVCAACVTQTGPGHVVYGSSPRPQAAPREGWILDIPALKDDCCSWTGRAA